MNGAVGRPRAARRSRLWAYVLLARVSNLPTVWSNVLAGSVGAWAGASTSPFVWDGLAGLCLSASAFYTGGMFLNDAFDAPFDERVRPERPIPRGDVSRPEVLIAGGGLLALGESLLRPNRSAMILGGILAAAIVFYNYRHKGSTLAPLVMGACRGLVYLIAATVVGAGVRGSVGGGVGGVGGGVVSGVALGGAGAIALYVVGLTVVAKRAGASARWLVPVLIAGISLVDAAFILVVSPSRAPLAVVAAMGFPLTLFLQRWVPGD